MAASEWIATMGWTERVWTVASVHGDARRLARLHRRLGAHFEPGDRVAYLGNILGRGAGCRDAVDNLLAFRRAWIGSPGQFSADMVVLRGMQEEMWHKLLQLQFAMDPVRVLEWMLDQGVAATLEAYGGRAGDGFNAARSGAAALARWTGGLRSAVRAVGGHVAFLAALRRAAETRARHGTARLLLVNAGIDPTRPLAAQDDSFWWGGRQFAAMQQPYEGFTRVIRGYDRKQPGTAIGPFTASIDGGCGYGGPLVAACFTAGGELVETLEA